jgi:trimeric autotransporter adhesin
MHRVRVTVGIAALVWMANPLPTHAQSFDDPCGKNHYILNAKCDGGIGEPVPTPAIATKSAIVLPAAIAADAARNVYFSSGNAIYKVDASGLMTRFAGNGVLGYSGDGGPAELAHIGIATPAIRFVDDWNDYAGDDGLGIATPVSTVEYRGYVSSQWEDASDIPARYVPMASGIAVDNQGNLYIADTYNNRVRKVDLHGVITTVAGNGDANSWSYQEYAFAALPNPIGPYAGLPEIQLDPAIGRDDRESDGGLAIDAQITSPSAVGVDSAGNLYVTNAYGLLRKVATNGLISTIAAPKCQSEFLDAGVCTPGQIAVDATGNVYAPDRYCRVRLLTPEGTVVTLAGDDTALSMVEDTIRCLYSGDGAPARAAELAAPGSVARDAAGNLYIADTAHNCIRKVDGEGVIRMIAGSCPGPWQYDGVLLDFPQGVAVDPAGIIYIADTGNGRILKLAPDGTITTIAGITPGPEGQP